MDSKEFWVKVHNWGHRLKPDGRSACLFAFDERGLVRDEEHRAAVVHLLNTSGRAAARKADALQDYLESPEQREIDAMVTYVRNAGAMPEMARRVRA